MIRFISFLAISLSFTLAHADIYLTPADFGLVTTAHGRIDYRYIPSNLLLGNCDSDCYPDILRSSGNKLEVYLLRPQGYTLSQVKRFPQPIRSMRWDGVFWDDRPDLTVVLADGSEEIFHHRGGTLDLRETEGFLPAEPQKRQPPRRLSGFEFDLAWESEPRPCGMNRIAVGDLDNDGINELVTWWKETLNGDSAWILIYKCVGDNQYELFMEEPFFVLCGTYPGLSYLLIADLDDNGCKELIYTYDRVYIWEFYAPGVYAYWNTNYYIWRFVRMLKFATWIRMVPLKLPW